MRRRDDDPQALPSILALPSIDWLDTRPGHRAIGVVYRPGLERAGRYVPTVLGRRHDAFCWFGTTSALRPTPAEISQIHREQETYPFGA